MRSFKIAIILLLFQSFGRSQPVCTLQTCGEPLGPGGGGTFSCVIASPLQPKVVFAANDMGGIFKSYNNGDTWNYLSRRFYGQSIVNMALHPTDSNIIYVQSLTNVCKSTDGGQTWQLLTALHESDATPSKPFILSNFYLYEQVRRLNTLAIDPQNPNVIYISGNYGYDKGNSVDHRKFYIYKSSNGGSTWSLIPSDAQYAPPNNSLFKGVITSIVVDPNLSNTLYVTCYYGFYKSTDGGQNWTQMNNGLPLEPLPNARSMADILSNQPGDKYKGCALYDLAVNPIHTDTMYVLTRTHGVYKTTDGGVNWLESNGSGALPGALTPYDSISNPGNTTQILHGCMRIDPKNTERLVLSISSNFNKVLWESMDGGSSWNNLLSLWPPSFPMTIDSTNPYSPNQRSYLIGQSGNSGGPRFDISISPDDPDLLFGANDWGIERIKISNHSTGTLSKRTLLWKGLYVITSQGCGTSIASLGNTQNIYIAGMDCSIMKTNNNGQQWNSMITPEIWTGCVNTWGPNTWFHCNSIAAIPTVPPTLFFTGYQTCHGPIAYKSVDDGNSWTEIVNGTPSNVNLLAFCRQVLPDPAYLTNNTVYLVYDSSGVYKSTDNGSSFQAINSGLPMPGLSFGDASLAIDPKNNQNLYLVLKGPVSAFYTSTNGGTNWTAKNFNNGYGDPLGGVTIIYYNGVKTILVSCQMGIWMSIDEGVNWKKSFDVSDICAAQTQSWCRNDLPITHVVASQTQPGRLFFMIGNWLGIPRMPQHGIYTSGKGGADLSWHKLFETPNFGGNMNISDDSKYLLQFSGGMGVWKYKLPDSLLLGTSLIEQTSDNIVLTPNPTTGKLYIQSPAKKIVDEIKVFDIFGSQVIAVKQEQSIDLSTLSQGIYIVHLFSGTSASVFKVLKIE